MICNYNCPLKKCIFCQRDDELPQNLQKGQQDSLSKSALKNKKKREAKAKAKEEQTTEQVTYLYIIYLFLF